MDCFTGFASSVARDLVCGAVDELSYPCCFNNFVDGLQQKEDKLIRTRNSVKNRVKHSKKQAIKNTEVFDAWLEESSPLKNNVEDLLKKARTNKSCCFGLCPNWIWRYHLAKKLSRKKQEIEKCIEEGKEYMQFERVASLPPPRHLSEAKRLKFESMQYPYEQILEALKDEKVTTIGLYGMGGCGKTTMALELMRTAETEHLFDMVLFVPVSSKVEVRKIQDKIASMLQFEFPEDGERERAQRLSKRLTLDDESTLVILDDVWQLLDFGEIGIPSGEDHGNCKVLITTRSGTVCGLMDCQRIIHLATLTDEEAWLLFQKQANISKDMDNNLKQLGRLISDECKGLPVAIAAMAGTLKGKAEDDWRVALDRLRRSIPVNIEKGLQDPYNCLRVSYNNLDTEEAKSLFLLCSVFPEDFNIPVETLIRIAIGLGIVGEVRSFEGARNEVSWAKNVLISSCLLSFSCGDDEGECVKMHDLVRNIALWIAKEENKVVKCALEKDVTFESNSIKYLWCKEVPIDLDCSSIELLCLKTDLHISDEVFERMERLKVLSLCWEGTHRGALSITSFKSLLNLRCLFLEWWDLGDISSIGCMKKLESLTLSLCSFYELPDAVTTQLTNLRLLHLSKCDIETNPFRVIGRQQLLEELYFYDYEWGFDIGEHAEFLTNFSVPQALQRYQIKLGPEFEDYEKEILSGHRTLVLSYFDTSNAAVVDLAKKADVLLLANIKAEGKNIIPDIFQIESGGAMNYRWIELRLRDSEKMECLVDTCSHYKQEGTLFSELRKLAIECMENLGALCHGMPPVGLFKKLEQLYIYKCPVLTCLFDHAVARNLVKLEKLEIVYCDGLKCIMEDDDREIKETNRVDDILVFSKLKQLRINGCLMLEYTIPVAFAQSLVQLESLEISRCGELKQVFGQSMNQDHSQSKPDNELLALKKLRLTSNSNMISIFPQHCSATLPSLQEFYLWDCPKFDIAVNTFKANHRKDVMTIEKEFLTSKSIVINNSNMESIYNLDGVDTLGQPISLSLQYLRLLYLCQMKHICVGLKNSFAFQHLKKLEIYGCEKVEVIFPVSVLPYLPELERLEITECQELKQIIEEDVESKRLSNHFHLQPCFPKLAALVVNNCHSLKRLFCASASNDLPNLKLLIIWGASELEELIGDETKKVKVELPKLKLAVLTYLSSLCQGIELPSLMLRVVHDCPKLSLTSSFHTLEDFEGKLSELDKDLEIDEFYRWKLVKMVGEMIKSDSRVEDPTKEVSIYFPVGPEDETRSTIEIHQSIGRGIEEGATSHNGKTVTLSTHSQSARPKSGQLVNSRRKSYSHPTNKDNEHGPIIIRDSKYDVPISPCVSTLGEDHPATDDSLVEKAVADIEESLKMPLKDIASSKANCLRLLTALKFLSHLPLEVESLSSGLKAIIHSLHQEFPSILWSFKQAFEAAHGFAVLEEKEQYIKEEPSYGNDKPYKAKKMEEIVKEGIEDCEADLSSLDEEKKQCILGSTRVRKEYQRKAREQLFEVNYKWSALCSQFQLKDFS
ncbi:hypothetical protein PIB30_003166 [Stylosanthes scabra]|uniref:AAA+ ATPase domain-containing protein n=1 Tax=Stylosanthes scabra TaxID=79078 RepID=A0ABU6Z5A2_9FABA|nr:hypothetical protein [Stylosanthes scabra]